jgi:hypothetical protein
MHRARSFPVFPFLFASLFAFIFAFVPVSQGESGLPRSERPKDARVYFITPQDGETLSSPIVVRFGLGGMGVAPAGVEKGNTGHHHLVVDAELPRLDLPVPKSEHYRHFGMGQTEVTLDLAPGKHTLQLLVGDHLHIPHDPPVVSEQISITVKE